ncbi:hypothetical protein HMPREF9624_00236 [Oribacterium asaccharolyticum ACB7]|uniref:C2H2-type domain-containing protein n=1 Tax=Oribacterium asaccharolyticum ACB7 TaxID=796944 RepID=G9WTK2_9FIRM|nr:hypothetical protein [Oribacterium asaccharolyticum]EHL12525.1 hypothetical protein HMPREF9624_00236 [Oribacterium asaccharolyticum ACB7]
MKKIETYQCELCGTEYKDKKQAQACERGHKKNLRVAGKEYSENDKYGFPEFVTVASEEPSLSAVYQYSRLTDESFYGGNHE